MPPPRDPEDMDRGLLLSALATDPAPKATVAPAVVVDKALLKEEAMAHLHSSALVLLKEEAMAHPHSSALVLLKEAAMANSSALALLKEAAMADNSAMSLHK